MTVVHRALRLYIAFGLLLSMPSVCRAQDQAVAQALFEEGLRAAESQDWQTACERFEESNRLDPAPGTMMNIGRCAVHLGQLARAWKSYVSAADVLPENDFRIAHAKRLAEELEPRVPHITLLPPQTEQPFSVRIDDMEVSRGSFGVPLPFNPGRLRIVVRAQGHEDAVVELELEEGVRATRQLELGSSLSSVDDGDATSDDGGVGVGDEAAPHLRPAPIVTSYAVGGAGVAAAIVGGVWAAIELPKVDESCSSDHRCNERGAEAAERGRVATIMTIAGASVAVVGLSLGTVLLAKQKRTSLALVPVRGGTALTLRGAF